MSKRRKVNIPYVEKPLPPCMSLKPKTKNQSNYLRTMIENTIVFATGPAGSGKSYLAIGLACQYLYEGKVDKIIIIRPAVEASPRGLGFLPGELDDKLGPYVLPAIEHMKDFLGRDAYYRYVKEEKIKFQAVEFCRGLTFRNAFVIVEESQNLTTEQLKMVITRIGEGSKMVIDGDIDQTDLQAKGELSDFKYVINKVLNSEVEGFGYSEFTKADIQRHPIIAKFLDIGL